MNTIFSNLFIFYLIFTATKLITYLKFLECKKLSSIIQKKAKYEILLLIYDDSISPVKQSWNKLNIFFIATK